MSATVNSTAIYVNGVLKHMDLPAVMKNDRVFIHIRPLAESFGYRVNWDNDTRTVTVEQK